MNVISEDEHCDLGVITGNDSIPQSVSAIDRDLAGAACLEVQRAEDKRKRQVQCLYSFILHYPLSRLLVD